MLQILTTMSSLGAQRGVSDNHQDVEKNLTQLASGSRINKAGDDAAGLALSKNIGMQRRSNFAATRNTEDAISLVQIAEGSFNEISNMLIRLREVAMMASSDSIVDEERRMLNLEVGHVRKEVDRITEATRWVSQKLLNGLGGSKEFQVGVFSSAEADRLKINMADIDTRTVALGIARLDFQTKFAAQQSIDMLDNAMQLLNGRRSSIAAIQNRLVSTQDNLAVSGINMTDAESRIKDADVAVATADVAKGQIISQAGAATLTQANQNQALALKLI